MKEKWLPVSGYENYLVSSFGRVKSVDRNIIMSLNYSRTYAYVNLSSNGLKRSFTIHRLVANAFIPNPKNKQTVNHINGNKLNNNVSNLEWATRSEQNTHASKLGLKKFKGEDHSQNKLTEEDVLAIRLAHKVGMENKKIHSYLPFISLATVRDVINRKSWNHI